MISKQIAQYVAALSYDQLPEEVVKFTKLCILDYFSSLIKGRDAKPVQIMSEVVQQLGGTTQATTITGLKTNVANAAFVNGGASHVIELDDIHKASIVHAATVIMPAAIAVAEWKQLSGKELITAIVAGYEIAFRVGETVSPSHYYYFHNTATCGTFGATVAVAKLLNLSEIQIIEALGSAGTQAAGLWEFIEDGAMSKQLHPGKAAMHGVLSCFLAEKGFTGAKQIFEGRRGFFEAMADEYDQTKMTMGLGEQYKIIENSFKVHASCRHTHSVMDLLVSYYKKVKEKDIATIEKIQIGTYEVALNITDDPNPNTIYAAKFSLQFCAALALLTGSGGYNSFNEKTLQDSSIRELMKKIEVYVHEEINEAYPIEWGATVKVYWSNGEIDEMTSQYPVGDPENPVNEETLLLKFHELASNYSGNKRDKIIEIILNLDEYKSSDLMDAISS
ncbi:MmgE/PrpD family protein [Lysinibacillus telephonicus]|uniref:MmgE/PrpD family protein n=1 Tax=Lysinibacillus telephonicus TaxID=1714840 RepID=A0A431UTH7_9BACI|nr:MmgE/PrpD family protein [Lysinibacillus telephonicus]RTQ92934.1 MmgE/PrpD family protein [Lysinibacillus telephonicus]